MEQIKNSKVAQIVIYLLAIGVVIFAAYLIAPKVTLDSITTEIEEYVSQDKDVTYLEIEEEDEEALGDSENPGTLDQDSEFFEFVEAEMFDGDFEGENAYIMVLKADDSEAIGETGFFFFEFDNEENLDSNLKISDEFEEDVDGLSLYKNGGLLVLGFNEPYGELDDQYEDILEIIESNNFVEVE